MIEHQHDGSPSLAYRDERHQLVHHMSTAHGYTGLLYLGPKLAEEHGKLHDFERETGNEKDYWTDDADGDPVIRNSAKQLSLWADPAMKSAVPQPTGDDGRVRPTVRILQATPDPLGTLAAIMSIYKGGVKRSLAEVSDEERQEALDEMLKTKLQGPLEAITFTILIEGVTRSFTHQMVRGRAAFYAQESMRFAVPDQEEWTNRMAYPPSLAAIDPESQPRYLWDSAVQQAEFAYLSLVNMGIPAEDARGLIPHAMTTRIVWQVSLRELLHVAGLRLCTQAQFEWRTVLSLVVRELRAWGGRSDLRPRNDWDVAEAWEGWQFGQIADLLRPVCYAEGKCGFMSNFDRGCKIRGRVEANAKAGRPSSEWGQTYAGTGLMDFEGQDAGGIPAIQTSEWLADPNAAR
jgi:thymidylate synthase (FAD)